MQIGKGGQKKTNADTKNLWEPADVFVYAKTNELFVADGYGNKRIVVFDADTGAFKRMWGAFGNVPMDDPPALRAGGDEAGTQRGTTAAADGSRWCSAVRATGARREGLDRRPRVRRGSWRPTRSGIHNRR